MKNKISFIKNGIEFIQGQNNEIDGFKKNTFFQMIHFIAYFFIIVIISMTIIHLLYGQVNKQNYQHLSDEDIKFNQI